MSTFHYDHPVCEIGRAEMIAHIEFKVQPASGDGRNEPHEPAWPEIQTVTLSFLAGAKSTPRFEAAAPIVEALQADDDLMECLLEAAGEDE